MHLFYYTHKHTHTDTHTHTNTHTHKHTHTHTHTHTHLLFRFKYLHLCTFKTPIIYTSSLSFYEFYCVYLYTFLFYYMHLPICFYNSSLIFSFRFKKGVLNVQRCKCLQILPPPKQRHMPQ
jgi:hypothetical protein